ncbi:hypothetical protein [Acaryochloris sp. IP29b_bin.137]|uniref:hypothetical protein n=1 Tax=Acaryochloris sp. IP29b_bin.137 TaxID=2969217 RepID=UPI002639CCA9|nr:hypothetical protein [Acaryochloris sp. IP29b_bin.137]
MKIRHLLFLIVIMPGIAGVAIFGHFALTDWEQLQVDYRVYAEFVQSTDNLPTLQLVSGFYLADLKYWLLNPI